MTTTAPVDLTSAEKQATAATSAADAVRARIAAGDATVTAADLSSAEQEERRAGLVLTGARAQDRERRDREAADQLARDRAAVQQEWAAASRGEPDNVRELRESAAAACADYLHAAGAHATYAFELHDRARELGFRVGNRPDFTNPPLPTLARAILQAARGRCPEHWLRPDLNAPRGTMWGD